jgi:hypothetical protein
VEQLLVCQHSPMMASVQGDVDMLNILHAAHMSVAQNRARTEQGRCTPALTAAQTCP